MKTVNFDPGQWETVRIGGVVEASGETLVKCSGGGALYMRATSSGDDILISDGETDVRVKGPNGGYWLKFETGGAVFKGVSSMTVPVGDVYTNAEKLPLDSPAEQAVKQYIHNFKLEMRRKAKEAAKAALEHERKRVEAGDQEELSESAKRLDDAEKEQEASDARNAEQQAEIEANGGKAPVDNPVS
jgi:hypothetical protein